VAASAALEPEAVQSMSVPIGSDQDLVLARHQGRAMAESLGFGSTEATLVATAISELARNIVLYARKGEIAISRIEGGGRTGICIVASDAGPGIANTELALRAGYSTSGGLGLGLPGVRRIMDEFAISSGPQSGTRIKAVRWRQR